MRKRNSRALLASRHGLSLHAPVHFSPTCRWLLRFFFVTLQLKHVEYERAAILQMTREICKCSNIFEN